MFIHIKQEGSALMSLKSMAGTLPSAGGTQSNSKTQEHGSDGRSDGEVVIALFSRPFFACFLNLDTHTLVHYFHLSAAIFVFHLAFMLFDQRLARTFMT